eukprot:gnl/MRDRNA2_/MRDRNA2_352672_c0_seq1.p1 gnl/MRDRNA2_/MRDRNA2_352672_c0~~gnl/MRDRNA2_/MRDRNA2_352672_c0_seq1.p1  ORF type:complete len:117 (+),score=13.83 gnl/MRDRNA2_/MRDRNA2_352672_c0_seq1:248-598(+)
MKLTQLQLVMAPALHCTTKTILVEFGEDGYNFYVFQPSLAEFSPMEFPGYDVNRDDFDITVEIPEYALIIHDLEAGDSFSFRPQYLDIIVCGSDAGLLDNALLEKLVRLIGRDYFN